MGQKINPTGFRLAVTKDWASKWFAKSTDFSAVLKQDIDVRNYLRKKLANASVGRVVIERPAKSARITIHSARPGVVIGKKGEDIEVLKRDLQALMGVPVHVNIEEIRKPELDAQIIAMQNAMRSGAKGIKIMTSGRLNGADIARSEWYREGRVPLHTLRANVDYATSEAHTTYGVLGLKVWVYTEGNVKTSAKPEHEKKQRKAGGRNAAAN